MSSNTPFPNLPVLKTDLSGKTVVVIGANTGIGLETAKHFARMNPAKLICGCRTAEKGASTVAAIEKETGFTGAEGWVIELSNFASVVAFAEKFDREGGRLDILVANSAVALYDYTQTADGWETTLEVNHLSTALLILLLVPHLLQTGKDASTHTRLVVVSSGAHTWSNFGPERIKGSNILETLNGKEFSTPEAMKLRYSDSKLLNVLFTRALTAHLPPSSPLVATAICPGFCISELRRYIDHGQFEADLPRARTAEEGSRQSILGAIGPKGDINDDADKLKGVYISNNAITPPSEWVRSEEGEKAQENIWNETIEILSKVAPKVHDIVKEFTV